MNYLLYEDPPTIDGQGKGTDAKNSYIKLEKAYDMCVKPIYEAVKPIVNQAIEMTIPSSITKLKVGQDFQAKMADKINKATLIKSALGGD